MSYHAYLRVSTDEQADSKAGLEAQLEACRRYAKGELAWTYTDEGISGATGLEKRPALFQAVGELKRGDVLLVAKRDRLGRDPIVVAMIEAMVKKKGAKIISAAGEGTEGDGPTDVLMRRIVDAFAEYERLVIKARTKAALKAKAARLDLVGEVRFGFDKVPHPNPETRTKRGEPAMVLVENAAEQSVLEQIVAWRAEGKGAKAIAKLLNAEGVKTKKGSGPWVHTAVARIIKRL